jgi:hypothetical protein
MDAAALLLRQKMLSKLSRGAKSKQQRQKEKHVATVGVNHPAVAASHKNTSSVPEIHLRLFVAQAHVANHQRMAL